MSECDCLGCHNSVNPLGYNWTGANYCSPRCENWALENAVRRLQGDAPQPIDSIPDRTPAEMRSRIVELRREARQ